MCCAADIEILLDTIVKETDCINSQVAIVYIIIPNTATIVNIKPLQGALNYDQKKLSIRN